MDPRVGRTSRSVGFGATVLPSPQFIEDSVVKVDDFADANDRNMVLTVHRLAAQDRGDNLGLVNWWRLSAVAGRS